MKVVLEPTNGTINGLGFWTLGWEDEINGKKYARYWPIEAPRKGQREALKKEAASKYEEFIKTL